MSKSRVVKIAGLGIGGSNPVRVESMLKTPFSKDFSFIRKELKSLEKAGCELLRIAVPNKESIPVINKIKKATSIPLMADVHFSEEIALKVLDEGIDSIRINPGNMRIDSIKKIARVAKAKKIPMRIGVNAASFKNPFGKDKRAVTKLVDILCKTVGEIEKEKFYDLIIGIKSSDVMTTILANELLAKKLSYPIHIGITEAGIGEDAIIKSAVGIGVLLSRGIGNTIRISLTDTSTKEVEVGYEILKALNLRNKGVEIISCPTCGRCKIDVKKIAEEIKRKTSNIKESIAIAVMGCEVNGPGEAKEADIGIAGGRNCVILFKKGKIIKKVKLPHPEGYVNKEEAKSRTLRGAGANEIVRVLMREISKK
ncbi:MAG: flavodoxin-dependent (E)-4-hydroxy-3-methylbut-2-enyl-diphosphate synthase [Candidatus Ratteibacteria bacterium]|nr:flavodoxin-dependent (E)-4-hydroxy-3-methylbut-2-enyl-diphosphate synthase [Candidatus Ratteibacteria bacterium]